MMNERIIADGLINLLHTTRRHTDSFPAKLHDMQDRFLTTSPRPYTEYEKLLRYYLRSFSFKFYLTTLHLEQLWSLAHGGNMNPPVLDILANSFDHQDLNDDSILLCGLGFESFSIQATAAFDLIALYLCCYFRMAPIPNISDNKLVEALEAIQDEALKHQIDAVKDFYSNTAESARRALLKRVRNSLVHRDKLYPSYQKNLSLLERVIECSPNQLLQERISEFCQSIYNDLYLLTRELLPKLYGLEWKAGPYRPGMWD